MSLYQDRKLAGICVYCGDEPAREDSGAGDRCFARRRVWKRWNQPRKTSARRRCGRCRKLGHFSIACEAAS